MSIDYSELLYKIGVDVSKELQAAIETHSLFTSPHHGYAIILEELDELWDEVKKKKSIRDVKNMRTEAVQVAAMAMKFIMSMDAEWKPSTGVDEEQKILQNETKCRQCLYSVITDDELIELGTDPCDSCHNLCNWKPKEVQHESDITTPTMGFADCSQSKED